MSSTAAIWAWLMQGLSGHEHVTPLAWAYWHARAMVLGWSLLLPTGMLIARFFKVTPRQAWPTVVDNPFWWRLHVYLQSSGVVVMSFGIVLAYGRGDASTMIARCHQYAGWALVAFGWTQVAAGLLRGTKGGPTVKDQRGDHYDMTRRRIAFEYLHKTVGWVALPVVIATTAAGLVMLDAPRWMAVVIGGWWICFAIAFACLQAAGRSIDTYQAIWGTDPIHPGNRRKPIGWRVRQHSHGAPCEDARDACPRRDSTVNRSDRGRNA